MKPSIIAAAILIASAAHAEPPPVGSDDWKIMEPYAPWIRTQHSYNGGRCCDETHDGRPVDAEIRTDEDGSTHWWVHVETKHWPTLPDHWEKVPDYHRVRPDPNERYIRPPFAMAWVDPDSGNLYCFWPGELY